MSGTIRTVLAGFVISLLMLSPTALGQVYSWVDENGKKHFGDRIPPEYQDQGEEVKMKATNSSDSVQLPEPEDTFKFAESRKTNAGASTSSRRSSSKPKTPSECAKAKRAYETYQRCRDDCRHMVRHADDQLAARETHPSCTKCKSVPYPGC